MNTPARRVLRRQEDGDSSAGSPRSSIAAVARSLIGTASNTIAMGPYLLYAALDVKTGQLHGMTAGRHTSKEFVALLEGQPEEKRARATWESLTS